jgi:2-polyprenyl-3-methyl-5-hydroxy-6-metoxy-1,4-benzoquinol methylase
MSKDIQSQRAFYDEKYQHHSDERNIDQLCRLSAIMDFLRRIDPRDYRILELGCGTGWLSAELARFGSVMAVDLSPEAIRVARARYPGILFRAANFLDDLSLGAGYDLVVASEVIEHVTTHDQRRFVQLASQQLTAHGHLIVTTPNRPIAEQFAIHDHDLQLIEHWLTIDELRALLHPCFRILTIQTTLFFQPFLRRHPTLNWLRYVFYCRLKALALTEHLLGRTPYGTYICCLAQKT